MLEAEDARDLTAGFDAIRAELGVPQAFGAAALAEAEAAAAAGPRHPTGRRRDLTALPFATLDPPGSRDLDQAMHLSRAGSGHLVRYAIADPAAFVAPGGRLDAATHERVVTVYCPDRRIPLHPAVLSEDAASLLPGVTRPAVVWTFRLDADGEVTSTTLERADIRSVAQLDYPGEQHRLDAGPDPDDQLALLAEIGARRAALELARGGVSLGRPEQEVHRLADGGWGLSFRSPSAVEEHNAQISLMTGMAAARIMLAAGTGVLRTMPPADAQDLARLRRRAVALGVPWPAGVGYGQVLRDVDHGLPQTAAFLAAATGLFRGAAWTTFHGTPPAEQRHGAVGAPYAHVTAPLRRLVDRYGSEVCLAATEGRDTPDWVLAALPGLGRTMAEGARRQSAVDRACTDLVEAAVLAPSTGRTFVGVAVDSRTVQLDDPAVVARVADADLPQGERVSVRLTAADPTTRSVTFEVVEGGAPLVGTDPT